MRDLLIRNVSKSFSGAMALSSVNLDLAPGRIHALMGENGAGKSTLIKILAGVQRADTLELYRNEEAVPLTNAGDAKNAGFRFIHQELNIVPHLSVAENILLGWSYPKKFGLAINWSRLKQQAEAALQRLGVDHIDVTQQAARLSTGDQMLMKIAGSLVSLDGAQAQLYVLDEPTAALSEDESEKLFDVLAQLKAAGVAILYVSHRMNEVLRICDDVTVLRDGKAVFSSPVAKTGRQEIIFAMTGRPLDEAYPTRRKPVGEIITCSAKAAATRHIRAIDFDLHAGEIIGIAGLTNAGQSEVLRMMMGLAPLVKGEARVCDQPLPASPCEAWNRHIAYVPRERRSEGLMLRRNVRDNIVLPHLGAVARAGGLADRNAETATATRLGRAVRLKAASLRQAVYELSGGNQQKVVFARAVGASPALLLLDEPTRGVDVGAKFDIYSLLRSMSDAGCGILLTSSDLPELIGICDRILIMRDGMQAALVETGAMKPSELLAQFYHSEAA